MSPSTCDSSLHLPTGLLVKSLSLSLESLICTTEVTLVLHGAPEKQD